MSSDKEIHESARFSPEMIRQMRSMALILAVSFLCTVVSIVVWFRENNSPTATISQSYMVQMDVLKDPDGVHGGENLLVGCRETVYCDRIITVDEATTKAYAMISNVGAGNLAVRYQLTLSEIETDGTEKNIFNPLGETVTVASGETGSVHEIDLTPGSQVRVQLYTAPADMKIHTASTLQELTGLIAGGRNQVYLTNDIAAEGTLCFDQSYPNINLAGYTLSASSIRVATQNGDFGEMTIENGTLVIGGKAYADGDTIPVTGDGQITVTLKDLK